MKTKFWLPLLAAVSFTCAMANQATIVNSSDKPITVIYAIAHQNPGQSVVMSAPITAEIEKQTPVNFSLSGYQLAGIVPISINGHRLPADVTQFATINQCSLATDGNKTSGTMDFLADAHHVKCTVRGGIFG